MYSQFDEKLDKTLNGVKSAIKTIDSPGINNRKNVRFLNEDED